MSEQSEPASHRPDAHALGAFVVVQALLAQLEAAGALGEGGRRLVMERALRGLEAIRPDDDLPSELIRRSRQLLEAWL